MWLLAIMQYSTNDNELVQEVTSRRSFLQSSKRVNSGIEQDALLNESAAMESSVNLQILKLEDLEKSKYMDTID